MAQTPFTKPITKIDILAGAVGPALVTEALDNPAHGGIAVFFGAVRNLNHGRRVTAVSYECHKVIAEKELGAIIREARSQWGEAIDAVVLHGTGRLRIGEISVGIGVSSPHRSEAFEACRYIIEELKVRIPIWKQEHYIDGDSEWLKGHELCQHGGTSEDHSGDTSRRT